MLDCGVFLVVILHVQAESLGKVAKVQQASSVQSITVRYFLVDCVRDCIAEGHGDIEASLPSEVGITHGAIDIVCKGECIATVDEKLPFGIVAFNAQLRQCSGDIDAFTDRLEPARARERSAYAISRFTLIRLSIWGLVLAIQSRWALVPLGIPCKSVLLGITTLRPQ